MLDGEMRLPDNQCQFIEFTYDLPRLQRGRCRRNKSLVNSIDWQRPPSIRKEKLKVVGTGVQTIGEW